MITTGIIKRINVDSKNYSNNKYVVEISLFKSVNDITTDKYTYEANACVPPGLFSPYEIGDKVYIGFINGRGGLPVILGKIYQGLTEEDRAYALYNTLKVTQKVELPLTTTIGNITGQDLKDWKSSLDLLSNKYFNEGIVYKTVMAVSPVINLQGFRGVYFTSSNLKTVTFKEGSSSVNVYQILYNGDEILTKEQILFYMKYMTGASYIPDSYEMIQNTNNIYRGGIICSNSQNVDGKGFGGYFATKNTDEADKYKLYIIKTHEFNQGGLTRDEVQKMIDEALSSAETTSEVVNIIEPESATSKLFNGGTLIKDIDEVSESSVEINNKKVQIINLAQYAEKEKEV